MSLNNLPSALIAIVVLIVVCPVFSRTRKTSGTNFSPELYKQCHEDCTIEVNIQKKKKKLHEFQEGYFLVYFFIKKLLKNDLENMLSFGLKL